MDSNIIEFSMVTFWDWFFQIVTLGIVLVAIGCVIYLLVLLIKLAKKGIQALDLYSGGKENNSK